MLRLLSVGSWLISNHHLWLVSSQRLGNVSWGTDTILQLVINRRGESSIQLQQFHKSGWYFYWWSSSSNNWWLETNQHWYCCWKSAASQTCIIFNKLVVTSQDLSVRQLFPLNRWWFDIKSSFLNNEESKIKNMEAFPFSYNISIASIFSHGHKDYCNGHYNPKLIFIHQSWPAQVKGSIIEQ